VVESRRVAGFLQAHLEIEKIDENLHMALRLHIASHHAEAHHGPPFLGEECRNDRMKRPLAGGVRIGMAGFEIKQCSTILQAKAEPGGTQPRSKAQIVALNERNHVVVFVRGCEIDRVALRERRVTRRKSF